MSGARLSERGAIVWLTLVLVGGWLGGCAATPPAVGEPGNLLPTGPVEASAIRWPERYEPQKASFVVRNRLMVQAPPERIWEELVQAEGWPAWYRGAGNVRVLEADGQTRAGDGRLALGRLLEWRTMDLDFVSRITEFQPPYRLAWESRRAFIVGYHAWLLIPTAEGTEVVTEETQFGVLAVLQRWFIPNMLRELHDEWLAGLRERAMRPPVGHGG